MTAHTSQSGCHRHDILNNSMPVRALEKLAGSVPAGKLSKLYRIDLPTGCLGAAFSGELLGVDDAGRVCIPSRHAEAKSRTKARAVKLEGVLFTIRSSFIANRDLSSRGLKSNRADSLDPPVAH